VLCNNWSVFFFTIPGNPLDAARIALSIKDFLRSTSHVSTLDSLVKGRSEVTPKWTPEVCCVMMSERFAVRVIGPARCATVAWSFGPTRPAGLGRVSQNF